MYSEQAGKVVIVSAPSGAGKSTIVHHLLEAGMNLSFSVSACSRPRREQETDGKDYYFLSEDAFREKIREDAFIEWEEVYPGKYYGTLKQEIHRIWDQGRHVLFDVDVKGGMNLKRIFGNQALALFIMPPSIGELEKRLRNRSTDTEESIRERVRKAYGEMSFAGHFDRIIVNDQLETALKESENAVREFLER
jgi:guanylate kinase